MSRDRRWWLPEIRNEIGKFQYTMCDVSRKNIIFATHQNIIAVIIPILECFLIFLRLAFSLFLRRWLTITKNVFDTVVAHMTLFATFIAPLFLGIYTSRSTCKKKLLLL